MKITRDMVGKRVTIPEWGTKGIWIEVLAVGETMFLGRHVNGSEEAWGVDTNNWELVETPETPKRPSEIIEEIAGDYGGGTAGRVVAIKAYLDELFDQGKLR